MVSLNRPLFSQKSGAFNFVTCAPDVPIWQIIKHNEDIDHENHKQSQVETL